MRLIKTIPVANRLGECVVWDHLGQCVWWTDIERCSLLCYSWPRGPVERYETPERLCSFGLTSDSRQIIAALESGFALFEPQTGRTRWLEKIAKPGIRLNDGRVGPCGGFWAGGMAERTDLAGKADLYCLDEAGRLAVRERGLSIANGICWNRDAGTFFLADSPAKTIWRFSFDPRTRALSHRQVFAVLAEGMPDGATVDCEGYLWSAIWGAGCLLRVAPDGRIDLKFDLPVRQPTCVAFGGAEMNLLFVTSARDGLEAASPGSLDGALLVYETSMVGMPEFRYTYRADLA
jgi:sugar lactone lactonase YvrE